MLGITVLVQFDFGVEVFAQSRQRLAWDWLASLGSHTHTARLLLLLLPVHACVFVCVLTYPVDSVAGAMHTDAILHALLSLVDCLPALWPNLTWLTQVVTSDQTIVICVVASISVYVLGYECHWYHVHCSFREELWQCVCVCVCRRHCNSLWPRLPPAPPPCLLRQLC